MTAMTSPLTGTPLEILRNSIVVVTGAMMNGTVFSILWKKPKTCVGRTGSTRVSGVLVEVADESQFFKTPNRILEQPGTRTRRGGGVQIMTTRESSMPSGWGSLSLSLSAIEEE